MENSIYQRTEILIGKDNVNKLKEKHILICGVGGVGSYALEALARVGIGKLTIVDKDVVDITNINRQLIATYDTIGKLKVEVAKKRIENINKEAKVNILQENITSDNIEKIIDKKFDYVVDCVDSLEAKIAIIKYCNENNITCISCMGMANKLNPLDIKVADIYKTINCPLARILRKKLKELNIKKQKVVYSTEIPKKHKVEENNKYSNTLGSVSFVPSTAGLVIASEVVKDLIQLY